MLSGQLLKTQDEERRRIARELHDSVGQLLTALSMNLSPLASENGKLPLSAAKAIDESLGFVEGTFESIAHDLAFVASAALG